jgi:hypothetical protein
VKVALALITAAAVAAFAPIQPEQVEGWFSTGIYPRIQHVLTPLGNLFPIALFDVLIAVAVIATGRTVASGIIGARRQRSWIPLFAAIVRLGAGAALVYIVFLAVWGFNYRRISMQDRLALAESTPGAEDVMRLGLRAVEEMNSRHERAHREGWSGREWQDPALRRGFDAVQRVLSDAEPAVPGRLKRTALGPYFRWTSIDGMVNPFGLEVLANPDLLPFERPFVAAHEWAHLAGYADESEASFVGWLTCLQAPSESARYSGWLFVYWQVSGEVPEEDRARLWDSLKEGPRRDITAVVERVRRGQLPLLRRTSWLVYDQYLKANRVEEGVRSYGMVLTLILRTRLDSAGVPVRRLP